MRIQLVEVVQMLGGLNGVVPSYGGELMRYPDDSNVQNELRDMFSTYIDVLLSIIESIKGNQILPGRYTLCCFLLHQLIRE